MSESDTFGPRLRRERERRGISLETIATVTKVGIDLWEGLERSDFSRWPSGIFARAFVRDYARAIGVDADEVVDEFCRLFPNGDRRAARIIQGQAAIVGHASATVEDPAMLPAGVDRRAPRDEAPSGFRIRVAPRVVAAGIDLVSVLALGGITAAIAHAGFWASTGVITVSYFTIATIAAGTTPGLRLVDVLRHRMPALFDMRKAHA
jgi:transcriptional regulator with XRE-family HTH domain